MKFEGIKNEIFAMCRSREGAWIEMCYCKAGYADEQSRSREGAWIEIRSASICASVPPVAPVRERGLK